jgi:S-formylglutathione hydrolase FrmB
LTPSHSFRTFFKIEDQGFCAVISLNNFEDAEMALIHCDFFSRILGLSTSMCVILPDPPPATDQPGAANEKLPALYLLHGLSDDHTMWQRRTSIERYAARMKLAIIMPAAHRSFYTDMVNGYRYWTFISEELPAAARSFFRLSEKREDTFAAGLSMGGYGAFKLALTHPERYAAAASLSGALDVARAARDSDGERRIEWENTFGNAESISGSGNDLFHLATQGAKPGIEKPMLYQCCGTEDFLYSDNLRFRDRALSLGLNLTWEEGPGAHEWGYWDKQIQRVLNWLPLRK